jgi:hypothetical protein
MVLRINPDSWRMVKIATFAKPENVIGQLKRRHSKTK